jgi:hypothetical protein
MNPWGVLFMTLSWGLIIFLMVFSFGKLFVQRKQQ